MLFVNIVLVNTVVRMLAVVFNFGIVVDFSIVGNVEDMAFVIIFMVVLVFGIIIDFHGFGHKYFVWNGGPKQVSIKYATNEPIVKPVIYDNVIILPGIIHKIKQKQELV